MQIFTLTLFLVCILFLSSSVEGKSISKHAKLMKKKGFLKQEKFSLPTADLDQSVIVANNAVGGFSSSSNSVNNAKSNNFLRLFVLFTVWYAFNAGCKYFSFFPVLCFHPMPR